MMDSTSDLYKKIIKSGNLPTLPEVLVKLLDVCDDEQRPLTDVSEIIRKDPVLSFKVLQLVNSAYYSLSRNFTSVDQAVVYLGAKSIKNIAITTAIHQVFEPKRFKKFNHFEIRKFWWHSLLSATLAKRIARTVNYSNCDEAYLSGLLHDIGKMVFLSTFAKEYDSFLADAKRLEDVHQAEKQLIGVTHSQAGAWLVNRWNLNSLMADAIKYHHSHIENIAESLALIKITYLANMLAHEHENVGNANDKGFLLLELGESQLQSIVSGATDEMYEVAEKLEITIEQPDTEKQEVPEESKNLSVGKKTDYKGLSSDALGSSALMNEEGAAQIELQRKVKDIALLTGILENISKAGSADEFIAVFEEAINVLFDFEKLLFLLLDSNGLFLQGRVSEANPYRQLSEGITFPTKGSSSEIIQTYNSAKMSYISKTDKNINFADKQILSVMNCTKILLIPLNADNTPVGIVLVGIPDHSPKVTTEDYKVLQILARQIAFSLHIERMKAQKAAELQQERMEAISMTARKFAHEVNNPLGIITNYLTSLKLKLSQEENIQSDINIIHEEIERIASMVNQLDLFSQPATQDIQSIDLNEVLRDIVQIIKNSLLNDGGVTINFEPCRELPPLLTSRDGIKQIIINLLKNASEAMEEGGTITITTKRGEKNLQSGEQDTIQIVVSDDGPGLPSSIRENLFSPFITTKPGNHSGLGLSIVYKIVQVLGGDIHVTSDSIHGTEFTIELPLEKT